MSDNDQTARIAIPMSEEMKKKVTKIAYKHEMSLSNYVRNLIEKEIKKEKI